MCTVPSGPKRALGASLGAAGAATALTRRDIAGRTLGIFSCGTRSNMAPSRLSLRALWRRAFFGTQKYSVEQGGGTKCV